MHAERIIFCKLLTKNFFPSEKCDFKLGTIVQQYQTKPNHTKQSRTKEAVALRFISRYIFSPNKLSFANSAIAKLPIPRLRVCVWLCSTAYMVV